MSMLGTTIGPYRLEDILGEGGMGRVYRAWDQRLERHVAVKHIRPEVAKNDLHRARFRREAWAVARLNHPSIVHIYDILENDAGDWIVMELVGGPSLRSMVLRGPLAPHYAAAYGRQIAEGLAEAHAKGIIHRDLKTENVLIAPSGQAKILDFGLAKTLERRANEETLSMTGAVIGTCRSMSPEQAEGLEVGPSSDLFSLGTLLYEVSTGISPFKDTTAMKTLARVVSHDPKPAHQVATEVPQQLSALISRLLVKEPGRRPASAALVAKELAEIETAQPLHSVGPRGPVESHFTLEIGPEALDKAKQDAPSEPRAMPQDRVWRRSRTIAFWVALGLILFGLTLWATLRTFSPSPRNDTPAEVVTPEPTNPEVSLRQAEQLLSRYDKPGHLDQAVELYQQVLNRWEENAEAHAGLSRAFVYRFYFENQDPVWLDLALPSAKRAIELDPTLAAGRVSLGLIYAGSGRAEKAHQELSQALLLDPQQADAHAGLGDLFLARGDLEAAEQAYKMAVQITPSQRRYQDLLGTAYFRHGRLEEAIAAFERSIEIAPDSFFGYRNLSVVYASQGNLEKATDILRQALEIQPHNSLFSNLGTYLFRQGLYAQAVQAFERALEMPGGANHALIWGNLGDAYRWAMGNDPKTLQAYERAVQLLDETLKRQPDDLVSHSRQALYLARLGECDASRKALAALEDLADVRLAYRRVLAAEACGDRSEALQDLERALEAGLLLEEVRKDPELFDLRSDVGYHRLVSQFEKKGSISPSHR